MSSRRRVTWVSRSQERARLWRVYTRIPWKRFRSTVCGGYEHQLLAQCRQRNTCSLWICTGCSPFAPPDPVPPQVHSAPLYVLEADLRRTISLLLVTWPPVGFAHALAGYRRRGFGHRSSLAPFLSLHLTPQRLGPLTIAASARGPSPQIQSSKPSGKPFPLPAPLVLRVSSGFLKFLVPGSSIPPCLFSSLCLCLINNNNH